MAITDIHKDEQYLHITQDGKVYRLAVRFEDTIVSAIISGRYKVLNIYRLASDNKFYAVYLDSNGLQQTVELGGAGGGVGDMTKAVYDVDNDGIVDTAALAAYASNSDKLDGYHWSDIPTDFSLPVDCGKPTSFVHNGLSTGEIAMIEFDGGAP